MTPAQDLAALVAALRTQRQIDMDGCEVAVSRQACDEAADTITALSERCSVLEGAVNWLDALLGLIDETSCDPDDEERFDETMMGARLALKAARAALTSGGRG